MFRHQVVMSKSPYLWVKIRISHIWQIIPVNPTFVPSSMVKSQEKHRKIYHSLFFLPQNHHLKHQGKTTGFPKPELSGVPQGSPAADRVCRVYLSICLSVYLSIHPPIYLSINQAAAAADSFTDTIGEVVNVGCLCPKHWRPPVCTPKLFWLVVYLPL